MNLVPQNRGRFLKIKCKDCGTEQIVFDRATTTVNCPACGATVATPQGGKALLRGEVVGTME